MAAVGGWAGGRLRKAVAHFLHIVFMVAGGCSKAAHSWRMAVLESLAARFFNTCPRTCVEFPQSAVIHRVVFQGRLLNRWVIAQ